MSIQLPNAFIASFDAEVHQAFQGSSKLTGTCRTRNGVVGSTHRFSIMGKGLAQQRIFQSDVTPMNVTHSNKTVTLSQWLAPEYSDIFAQSQVNFDEKRELVKVVAAAMGRRKDQLIIDSALTPAVTNTVAVALGGSNAFNVPKLRRAAKILSANGVPSSNRHLALSATALEQLLGSTQATSGDFNTVRALVNGEIDTFVGFKFHVIEDRLEGGLPLAGNNRTIFAWHYDAVGCAIGMPEATEMNYIPEKTSWLVTGKFSGGAINIDDDGIVQITIDESVVV